MASRNVEWRKVASLSEFKSSGSKCFHVYAKRGKNWDLAMFLVEEKFYAMDAWCSHLVGPLFNGDIEDIGSTRQIICPWHGYSFDLESGLTNFGLQQETYEVKIENDEVYVKYISDLSLSKWENS